MIPGTHRTLGISSTTLSFSKLSWSDIITWCLVMFSCSPPTTLVIMLVYAVAVSCWILPAGRTSGIFLVCLPWSSTGCPSPEPEIPLDVLSPPIRREHTLQKHGSMLPVLVGLPFAPGMNIPCSSFQRLFYHPALFPSHHLCPHTDNNSQAFTLYQEVTSTNKVPRMQSSK